jgi:hypothetical protein
MKDAQQMMKQSTQQKMSQYLESAMRFVVNPSSDYYTAKEVGGAVVIEQSGSEQQMEKHIRRSEKLRYSGDVSYSYFGMLFDGEPFWYEAVLVEDDFMIQRITEKELNQYFPMYQEHMSYHPTIDNAIAMDVSSELYFQDPVSGDDNILEQIEEELENGNGVEYSDVSKSTKNAIRNAYLGNPDVGVKVYHHRDNKNLYRVRVYRK